MPASVIVTLTTDFGLSDPYVGAMKGVLLCAAPGVQLVDLSHQIAPQDVAGGDFLLRHAAFEFPPGTVHLAVVDPGVGSDRRPLAVDAGGYRWVGPDNGLLSCALERPGARARQIAHPRLGRPELSATFHGRDLFGPAAARLARGFPFADVGPLVTDAVRLLPIPCRRIGDRLEAAVVQVDRFGNLITAITARDLNGLAPPVRVRVGGVCVDGLVRTYADAGAGQLAALVGSGGLLEVGVNGGSAAERLQATRGTPVTVEPAS